jgi:hypothetical protein
MAKPLDSLIMERLYAREVSLVTHANAIDQKTSYLLVAVTFLGLQISSLLTRYISAFWRYELIGSGVILVAAAIFLFFATKVANYDDEGAEWLEEWRNVGLEQNDSEDQMLYAIRYGSRERILKIAKLLKRRGKAVEWCFYLASASFAFNMIFIFRVLASQAR